MLAGADQMSDSPKLEGMADTPPTEGPGLGARELTHKEFLEKALVASGEWSRFADPKVLGVFIFLGLGMANLIEVAGNLWDGKDAENVAGWMATGGFAAACLLAVLAVLFASLALFPQLQPGGRTGKGQPSRSSSLITLPSSRGPRSTSARCARKAQGS